jgi:DNA-binding FadR family transcriptional regulator
MVKTHRRYQEIAGRISRYIAENNLHPGARLPGEIDLAKVCGVSRPTIREAMIALEIAGELEIRSGSGAYVREAVNPMSLVLDSGPGPFELLRARLLIEGETAADAALYASASDLAKIEKTLEQMRQAMRTMVDGKVNAQVSDRQFHVAIGEAAKNSVLASIINGLWAGMFAPMYHRLSQRAGLEQHQAAALEDHEAIFNAIAARDPNEARRAMRRHLQHVEEHLTSDTDEPDTREKVTTTPPPPAKRVARGSGNGTTTQRRN